MSGTKVRIAARIRPKLPGEIDDGGVSVCQTLDTSGGSSNGSSGSSSYISVRNGRDNSQNFKFHFTSCYDESSSQDDIFQNDVQPLIDYVYEGMTVTVFAYGVTSSGKTYTIQGSNSDPGIIPKTVESVFNKKANSNSNISISFSYMEIYKDEVYDLLVNRENASKLPVRENDMGMVFVANLTTVPVYNVKEFNNIYNRAVKSRSVGSTNLNHASSRSHAILTLHISVYNHSENKVLSGKINVVDLAGSENNKLTGNDSNRMAESSAINKSLSVLGQVVRDLNLGKPRIPYRNSKLTRILQDALGGHSISLLICNIAPGTKFRQDTLNTLHFASSAKTIENKPVINERDVSNGSKTNLVPITQKPASHTTEVLQPMFQANGLPPNANRQSLARGRRPSMVPRYSRLSGAVGGGFQNFALPAESSKENRNTAGYSGLTDKELDERISKAVEMEVQRRLEERERERQKEEEQLRRESDDNRQRTSLSPVREVPLPSGVLTPLLKRHKDLDDEMKSRLNDLEMKYERGNKEVQLADVLSPVSKKKTGRAYVALARAHSEKGNLQVALDLYRKAETYVPDNIKLKERIIELEWSVKNGTEFIPSPKKPRKNKTKKSKHTRAPPDNPLSDDQMDAEEVAVTLGGGSLDFGISRMMETPVRKRPRTADDDDDANGAHLKRLKNCTEGKVVVIESDEEGASGSHSPLAVHVTGS